MEFLLNLWLPILLSAVLVFVVSSIIHVILPIHRGDYQKLPGEENVLKEMRNQGVQAGAYAFPFPDSMKEMASPEMIAKYKQGPVGFLTVVPSSPPAMGKSLIIWFLYSLIVGVFVAYIAMLGLGPGAKSMLVFRITGAVAVLGYAIGHMHDSTWKGQSWGITLKFILDGVIYGVITAATFTWLWPAPG